MDRISDEHLMRRLSQVPVADVFPEYSAMSEEDILEFWWRKFFQKKSGRMRINRVLPVELKHIVGMFCTGEVHMGQFVKWVEEQFKAIADSYDKHIVPIQMCAGDSADVAQMFNTMGMAFGEI